MPLDTNDWIQDTFVDSSTVTILHNVSTPIEDDRSVRFTVTTGGSITDRGVGSIFLDLANHTRGFELGRIRTLIRVDQQVDQAGIFCMGSADVGIATAGNAYTFGPVGATNELTLMKLDAGLADVTPSVINATGVTFALGTVKAIELEWKADLTIFGGTQIICRAGDAADFSDLAIVFQGVDETAPYLTSLSEGLFCFRVGLTSVGQATFDDTTVFKTNIV